MACAAGVIAIPIMAINRPRAALFLRRISRKAASAAALPIFEGWRRLGRDRDGLASSSINRKSQPGEANERGRSTAPSPAMILWAAGADLSASVRLSRRSSLG